MSKTALTIFTLAVVATANAGEFTRYVDPFIGTGPVEGSLSGNNYPGATMPFGMVQLSPDTHEAPDWYNASGYDYNDCHIYGFSHTRLSGTGASDLIDILVMPTTSDNRVSAFSHSDEIAKPGYYKVRLADDDIVAELSATPRVGIHRYTFPADSMRNLWLDLDHSAQKGSWDRRIINSQIRLTSPTTIEGYRVITGWAKLRKVYFVAEFSEPIAELILFDGNDRRYVHDAASVINGRALRALASFGRGRNSIIARVGISGVSIDNARQNMAVEAPHFDFDRYAADADAVWDSQLGKIEVKGESDRMKTFYTALYHTLLQPNVFSDINGQWTTPIYTTDTLPDGETQYTTFSLWDTYRGAHPLYTIIDPEHTKDFVNSMLRHYDHYGYLPIWHLWGQDNYCMIGNHAIPVIVDAVLKGVPGIDADHAWEAVKTTSLQAHPNSPFDVWEHYGYMPEDIQTQSVSITLEMAFDDWCVARMAEYMGDTDAMHRFDRRAHFFRNLYNPDSHFFAPKDSLGNWIEPFDPLLYGANGGHPFTEGNAWQYYWYVPHDINALVDLTGGPQSFTEKLDTFFTLTDTSGAKNDNISGLIGQYAHGNEPSHHVAYLYNYVSHPEKTRKMVYRIATELYNNDFNGYAGNDDCGEMSAWYIFSAMGFYPVNPASGEYSIGLPLFDECTIHLPDGKEFKIIADRRAADSTNLKQLILNGHKLPTTKTGNILTHKQILNGGTLYFTLQ